MLRKNYPYYTLFTSFVLLLCQNPIVIAQSSDVIQTTVCEVETIAETLFTKMETCAIQFKGAAQQMGCFAQGSEAISLSDGIILSTGNVVDAIGPNSEDNTSTKFSSPAGDPDLKKLILGEASIVDVTALEFDIVATSEVFTLEYVFASEEYCEYVGSNFTDVFGIFISGPGINGSFSNNAINLATLPETAEDVSIKTVNGSTSSGYYVSNVPLGSALFGGCSIAEILTSAAAKDLIEFDGFTVPLEATTPTIMGATYHVKIVIGDVGDRAFDSALFFNVKTPLTANCNPLTMTNSDQLFTDYPWVTDLIDFSNCNGEKITAYNAGSHQFLYIENESGGNLYQNGTFYCASSFNYNCLTAYNLREVIGTWECATTAPTTDNNGNSTEPTPPLDLRIFEDYPWLTSHIAPTDCTNKTITVYETGDYQFFFIGDTEGGTLYFQDGSFYCTSTPSYDCLQAYNLTTIVRSWSCGATLNTGEPPTTPEETTEENGNSGNEGLFTDYPWLAIHVNKEECNGEVITVYPSGATQFFLIETATSSRLYSQNGALYCTNAANYDCLSLYNLAESVDYWACGNGGSWQQPSVQRLATQQPTHTDFKVFPNPSTGTIYFQLPPTTDFLQQPTISVYAATGQLVRQLVVTDRPTANILAMDLNSYPNGIYFVEWEGLAGKQVQKIIIE